MSATIEQRTEHGVTLIAFPPAYLGVAVDAVGANLARPHTAKEALRRAPSGVAVLNGPMFEVADKAHPHYRDYAVGRLDYRHYDANDARAHDGGTRTDAKGITLSVVDGVAVVLDGDQVAEGAGVAVQLYPTLVRHGVVIAGDKVNTSVVWRSGVAVLSDGRLAFAVGKMPMHRFAAALALLGAVDAGYTDGGGSTRLAIASGAWFGDWENRRVPSWLVVDPTRAPT